MSQPVLVWCEIPVSNIEEACDFYSKAYGYTMAVSRDGPSPSAVLNGVMDTTAGNLYEAPADRIGTGNTVHLALLPGDTVEAAAARTEAAGGTVTGPLTEMPFGRWTYATDPDGNSIGLFQAKA